MDRSQDTLTAIDELRVIRQDTRQTRSLDKLRRHFDRLQNIRRLYIDDFDLQVIVAEIHEEVIERARYLRGETPSPKLTKEESQRLFPEDRSAPPKESQPSKPQPPPADEQPDAALIPPEVPRLDPKSWQIAVGLALFLTVIVLAAFFYLIQTARKINFKDDTQATASAASGTAKSETVSLPAPVSLTPTLRLYTDLIPATLTLDEQLPRDVKDGELLLDHLAIGPHTVKLTGRGGMAAFKFDISEKGVPQIAGTPTVSNALAVLVAVQGGQGHLVTNAKPATILLDGKPAGEVGPDGLALPGLGVTDHDLQVTQEKDRQRFVLTYTPAPVLTVYVKSDPTAGTLVVMAGQDGVDVYIANVLYRRQTEHGQLRIPLQPGKYAIRVHKAGFADPPPSSIEIKKAEETEVQFHLAAALELAALQIKGGVPGTALLVDADVQTTVGADGSAALANIKPGDRTIELRHDQFVSKRFVRTFRPGETIILSGADLTLQKLAQEVAAPAPPAPSASAPGNAAAEAPATDAAAAPATPVDGERVQKGGGFIPYGTPKAPGRYSFQAQGRVGGFLKHGKLQWYAGYLDSQNYILFIVDGKHASVREIRGGKSIEWNRVPFSVESNQWVQVDLSVKPNAVSAQVRTPGGAWSDIGTVNATDRDFTQQKVGLYIPEKDEVAVANFRFTAH